MNFHMTLNNYGMLPFTLLNIALALPASASVNNKLRHIIKLSRDFKTACSFPQAEAVHVISVSLDSFRFKKIARTSRMVDLPKSLRPTIPVISSSIFISDVFLQPLKFVSFIFLSRIDSPAVSLKGISRSQKAIFFSSGLTAVSISHLPS